LRGGLAGPERERKGGEGQVKESARRRDLYSSGKGKSHWQKKGRRMKPNGGRKGKKEIHNLFGKGAPLELGGKKEIS